MLRPTRPLSRDAGDSRLFPPMLTHLLTRVPCLALLGLAELASLAQDRFKTMPGYERFQKMSKEIPGLRQAGRAVGHLEGRRPGLRISRRRASATASTSPRARLTRAAAAQDRRPSQPRAETAERGARRAGAARPRAGNTPRPFRRTASRRPSTATAISGSATPTAPTPRRHHRRQRKTRVKYGTANWVYGEELYQTTAIWWSTNSQKLAFYRFDESQVQDYYLTLDQTKIQNRLDVEPYMKAGTHQSRGRYPHLRPGDRRRPSRWTSATASRSTTPWSATTSMASPGRRTARNCSFTAPTAGRTSWSSAPPIPRPAVPRHRARGMAAELDREPAAHALSQGRQALHLDLGAHRLEELLPLRPERRAAGHAHRPCLRGGRHRARG